MALSTHHTIGAATTVLSPIARLAKSTRKALWLALALVAPEERAFGQRQDNLGFVTVGMPLIPTISTVDPLLVVLLLAAVACSGDVLLLLGSPGPVILPFVPSDRRSVQLFLRERTFLGSFWLAPRGHQILLRPFLLGPLLAMARLPGDRTAGQSQLREPTVQEKGKQGLR